jgi:hypothetical protein
MLATPIFKKVFIVISLLLIVALVLVFALAPGIAERRMNLRTKYRSRPHSYMRR